MIQRWFHKLFVPHSGNDHSPHFWRHTTAGIFLSIVLFAEIAVFAQSFLVFNKDFYLASVLPSVLTSLTNKEREDNKLSLVTENPLLVEAAKLKAEDMATREYFSHNTPEGRQPWYWLEMVGYTYEEAGENLAVNFHDSKDVVNAWMKSPTHRENIVKNSYSEMGIAMAEGVYKGQPAIYVAQFFGKPKETILAATSTPIISIATTTTKLSSTTTQSATTSDKIALVNIPPQVAGVQTPPPDALQTLAASPRHAGIYIMLFLLCIILAAYLILVFSTKKVHHPRILFSIIIFILIIGGLMMVNSKILKERIVIGEGENSFIEISE